MKNNQKELKRQLTLLKNQNSEYKKREEFLTGINVETIESFDKLTIQPNPRLREEVIAISTLSDVHVEEPVVKSVVNNLNEYNLTIAGERVTRYFKRLMYMVSQARRAGYRVDNLVLGLLGDFITGYIHEEIAHDLLGRSSAGAA